MISYLTDQELEQLKKLAYGRMMAKESDKYKNITYLSQEEADTLGLISEYVVAKYLNIPFDLRILLGGDNGTDLYLGDWQIQVKATKYDYGKFIIKRLEDLKLINILVYCRENARTVDIKGYISDIEFRKNCNYEDLGHGSLYTLDQRYLKDITKLPFYYQEFKHSTDN